MDNFFDVLLVMEVDCFVYNEMKREMVVEIVFMGKGSSRDSEIVMFSYSLSCQVFKLKRVGTGHFTIVMKE